MRREPLTHPEGNEGLYGHEDHNEDQDQAAGSLAVDRRLPQGSAGTGTTMVTAADELTMSQPVAAADELETFVTEHYGRLIRLAGLVCHDLHEAEDAVQAALERAWRRRGTLADPERMRPWLDRIVVNEAIRSKSRQRPTVVDLATTVGPSRADEWAGLREAFRQLSTEQRAVVVLHLYAGYSLADTAELVGAPLETVRSRLRLARQHLRQLLAEGPTR
jgi:RNA polymerase sigma-70 factor (ECF subfamily)